MSVSYGGDSITFADGSVNSSGFIGFRNRIINGAMEIDQRNAGASVTVNNNQQYPVDRFIVQSSTSTQFTAQRSTTAPTGFSNSLLITTSTANASAFNAVWQRIEANNTKDLDLGLATAKTFTVSFWVRSSVIGTYTFYAQNSASSYSYVSTYTINVIDTWEYKTITIAAPTAGTWLTGTNCSLQILWSLGGTGGTTSTLNSWQVANVYNASGATGIYNTGSATFYITGVQVERGSTASSFDYRDFGREVIMCQRYYEKSYNLDVVPGTNSLPGLTYAGVGSNIVPNNYGFMTMVFRVTKRINPTVYIYSPGGTINRVGDGDQSVYATVGTQAVGTRSAIVQNALGANLQPSAGMTTAHFTAESEL